MKYLLKILMLIMATSFYTPAFANDRSKEIDLVYSKLVQVLPANSELIAAPFPTSLDTYGEVKKKIIDSEQMIGGEALTVSTEKAKNAYDAGVILALHKDVKKGDVIYLMFFAQANSLPVGAQHIQIKGIGVQQNSEPYNSLFANDIVLSKDLESFAFAGIADKDYKADELQVTFQVATAAQKIDMGPVFVFNVGAETSPNELPYIAQQ